MTVRALARLAGVVLVAGACDEAAAPAPRTAASIELRAGPSAAALVGTSVGPMQVRITDSAGAPLSGVVVRFTVSQGAGRAVPAVDTSDVTGMASTVLTLSSVAGPNEVSVVAAGLPPLRVSVTGSPGPTDTLSMSVRAVRLAAAQDSSFVSVVARDVFGNPTGDTVRWVARDSTLVRATAGTSRGATGVALRVLRRPGQTWVVATAGDASDSTLVAVHDSSSRACDFLAPPTALRLGESLVVENGSACVLAPSSGAEYALVLHHNTAVSAVSTSVEVTVRGIQAPAGPFPLVVDAPPVAPPHQLEFERALRAREAREAASRAPGARAWWRADAPAPATALYTLPATAKVGDIVRLNVNAFEFCDNPKPRDARVVALSATAVVLADTANPPGGFSDDEYRAFGSALDTLVHPVVTAAFGAPTDIDGNGRVGILFTRAVNELTPPGAAGIVLGFYYLRDLLPVRDAAGECVGSNMAEMFYVLVPDPEGTVTGVARSREFVRDHVVGTIAHEYQHLVNASRRMYVTRAPRVDEELWLNEGLSHIAEELVFYEAAGISSRANIGAADLAAGTPARAAFDLYQQSNFARYREYLRSPGTSSPLAHSDGFEMRGAVWSFLRYVADRLGPTDGDIWRRLVNSSATGVSNLEAVLAGSGFTVLEALRDWSVSVLIDDTPADSSVRFRQPSWNFVTGIPHVLPTFGLVPRQLNDGVPALTVLAGGGNGFLRFAVAGGGEAFVSARAGGSLLPPVVRATLVRIR